MKQLILAVALACSAPLVTSCATVPVGAVQNVQQELNATMATVERVYKLSRTIGELGVDAGVIRGATATRLAALDNSLYAGLLRARSAYQAGNLALLIAEKSNLETLADQVNALARSN